MSVVTRATVLRTAIATALMLAGTAAARAAENANERLEETVVTASRMHAPLVVETDPRAPRQPLPAHDGADYLKTIPGFSVIRKGGTDGDPVFRGMAASRINMLLDGEQILGGCGNRMDPPTAYVFPEAYDRVVVIKGPQTVLHGAGNSAATVLFESTPPDFTEAGWRARGSALGGSARRNDLVGDIAFGNRQAYARVNGTRAEADDYEDGAGTRVHSEYLRWNTNAVLGWTPNDTTRIELTGALSDGEAAYADRAMDGVEFQRENVGLKLETKELGRVVSRLELQAYYNYVDHVMDNYSLRSFAPSAMMPGRAVSNPDRRTTGGRLAVDLQGPGDLRATLGIDRQDNRHRVRSTMNETMMPYENMARVEDARFQNTGLFAESTIPLGRNQRVVAGLRADRWEARDSRARISLGMMGSMPNPTANAQRRTTLESGFARFERDLTAAPMTLYAGLGHVQRFPDYWELLGGGKESADSLSAFSTTRPEKTTQLDVGMVYRSGRLALSLSGFASDINDYILIQSNFRKGMRRATIARNVDAKTIGAEADAVLALTPALKVTGTLAYTRGTNDTDGGPLAQMPPLELRAGLDWHQGNWSAGLLTHVVAAQKRFALNQGNIVGQDLGRTGSFAVVSLNGAWRATPHVLISAGVDNLLDRVYAEHLSRGGSMISGFVQTTRVNEPGRTLWLKLSTDWR